MNEEFDLEELAPWLVLAITLVGGFLRVLFIDAKGMWLDETFSVWLANQRIPELIQWNMRIDPHPPLYYLLLHFWIALNGDTPYDARLLSALFGTATIPVIYLIGKRLTGALLGLIAAVILAFSPFNIFFAQEARMYTLLACNAAVAIYALARLLTDPRAAMPIGSQFRQRLRGRPTPEPVAPNAIAAASIGVELPQTGWRAWIRRHLWSPIRATETDLAWVAFIFFSAATMLTHSTAVFLPVATNIFVLGLMLFQRFRKSGSPPAFQVPSLVNWGVAQLGILLLWSLWLIGFLQQANRVYQEFWIPKPTWGSIYHTFRTFLNASAPGQSQDIFLGILCVFLVLALVYYRKKLAIFLFLATLFVVPFAGELIVSLRRPIFYDRTLIWITVPLFLLVAAGIVQLRYRILMVIALGLVMTNYLFTTGDYYTLYQKEDWAAAAGYVANFAEQGDLVLFNSNFVEIPFDYYFEPWEAQYSLQVVKQGVPKDLLDTGILEPKMTVADIPALQAMVNEYDRVWLVYSHDSYTDPTGIIPDVMAAQKDLLRTREFYGGMVQLYGTP